MQTIENVLHAPMPFTTGGQTINDRLTAAKQSLAGSQLGKSICKATTEECIGPKKKHLDYLLHCTHEPNVSIPQMANLLIDRTQNSNWCVVFKALVTIHNLMCYGNERFTQYLASCNANFNLGNFLDRNSVSGYDMSTHVRRYAKYISEKIYTYRICVFDFCKVKRGKEDGMLRTMPADKLIKTLPLLQGQVDALIEFQVSPSELTNGIINSCFILLFRDLIRLFACYNDGIINLLEKYFDMNKKQCKEALDLYKQFLVRMDKVSEFLKVAEAVGVDRGEIPDLAKAPNSLLEALEQHLAGLDGNAKVGGGGGGARATSSAPSGPSKATQSAIQQLSFGMDLDEAEKQKYLREEQERLNMLKEQKLREGGGGGKSSTSSAPTNNPFLNSGASGNATPANQQAKSAPVDDLLGLDFNGSASSNSAAVGGNNPFATGFDGASYAPQFNSGVTTPYGNAMFGGAAVGGAVRPGPPNSGPFAPDFSKAFGGAQPTQTQSIDPLGDFLIPTATNGNSTAGNQQKSPPQGAKPGTGAKMLTSDLDSSLASLALNLNIDKTQDKNKPVQWGGNQPKVQQSSTIVSPNTVVPPAPTTGTWMGPPQTGYGMGYGQPQVGWGAPMMGGGPGMMPMQPGYSQQYPGMMGAQPMMGGGMMRPGFVGQQQPQFQRPQQPRGSTPAQDPFSAF